MKPKLPRHHRQLGDKLRVRIANGPTVDASTAAALHQWHAQGLSYGVAIDRLVAHALATQFNPAHKSKGN